MRHNEGPKWCRSWCLWCLGWGRWQWWLNWDNHRALRALEMSVGYPWWMGQIQWGSTPWVAAPGYPHPPSYPSQPYGEPQEQSKHGVATPVLQQKWHTIMLYETRKVTFVIPTWSIAKTEWIGVSHWKLLGEGDHWWGTCPDSSSSLRFMVVVCCLPVMIWVVVTWKLRFQIIRMGGGMITIRRCMRWKKRTDHAPSCLHEGWTFGWLQHQVSCSPVPFWMDQESRAAMNSCVVLNCWCRCSLISYSFSPHTLQQVN